MGERRKHRGEDYGDSTIGGMENEAKEQGVNLDKVWLRTN